MVSVFFADTVEAKARQTSTMAAIILASPCGDRETMQASCAYSMSHSTRQTQSIAGSDPIDVVGGSFRCTSSARMTVSSLNLWRTTVNTAAKKILNNRGDRTHPCRSPCSTSNQSEKTPSSGRTQSHPIVESLDDCYHLRWYPNASEHLPHEGAVNGVARLLEIYEAHEVRHSCLPPNFLQSAHHKHHVRGRAILSKPALLLR